MTPTNNNDSDDQPLDSRATAKALGASVITVRRLIKRGALKRIHGLGRIQVTPKEISRFLEGGDSK